MKIHPFVRYTLPLLMWLSLMFSASSDAGSSAHTRPLVQSLLRRFLPSVAHQLPSDLVDRIDFNLRKSAHVTEYLLLAILAYRAIRGSSSHFRNRQVLFPMVLGIVFAISDEWHQSFVPSRWAVAADVVYDSFGVTLGTLLCQWRAQQQREKKQKSS